MIKDINELPYEYKVKIEESSKKLAEISNTVYATPKKFDEYGFIVIMCNNHMLEIYVRENDFRIDKLNDLNMYSLIPLQLSDAAFSADGKLIKNRWGISEY